MMRLATRYCVASLAYVCFGSGDPTAAAEPGCASEIQRLAASVPLQGDRFGVRISAEDDLVVVGADAAIASHDGSARVFETNGDVWNQLAKLTASDGQPGDNFANSVSISDDVIVVGAQFHATVAGSEAGTVYVFHEPESGWQDMTETLRLAPADAAAGDRFGSPVSVDEEFLVAGAHSDDDAGSQSGSAYVFERKDNDWVEVAKLTASDAAGGDLFGFSAAIDGDLVVVGAVHDDTAAGADAGSAYVFRRNGNAWIEEAMLVPADAAGGAQFGLMVAIEDETVLVGARDDASGVSDAGSAYVFERIGSAWIQVAKLTASNPSVSAELGNRVELADDWALVGATRNGLGPGSAYLFQMPDAGWQDATETFEIAGSSNGDLFGLGLALEDELLFVGAPQDDTAGNDAGTVVVFDLECEGKDDDD